MLRATTWASILAMTAALGCGDDGGGVPDNAEAAVANYAAIVSASYQDSLTEARAMGTAIDAFLADPGESNLTAARNAWLASREPYLQTEVYRFYDGPIDNPTDGPEGLINAWPLDEAYIDYVVGMDTAGVVNDTSVTIDAATLEGLNEQGGEANIATGFHAIEFLLWGQDLSDTGPGARPATDFADGGTAANQDRRRLYLETVTTMLEGHLQGLVDAWADGASYRDDITSADPSEGLRRILTGRSVLSGFETGGERLQAALDSGDQEDEHSCFSDNTHRDMIQDIQGVLNVWNGSYGSVSGTGIKDVVMELDADLAAQLDAKIAESLSLANALMVPFDQEIAEGNADGQARVEALVTALRDQEELLEDVFRGLDLEIPVVE